MPNRVNTKWHEKKKGRFLKKHPEGYCKWAAEKELKRQTERQQEHITRGRKGHKPKPRKVLQ